VVVDRDVGNPDPLHYPGMLAVSGQIQDRGLRLSPRRGKEYREK
jgi:hypothetical protein